MSLHSNEQCQSQSLTTIYRHLLLYRIVCVVFTSHQENVCLQQTVTITEESQLIKMKSCGAQSQWIRLQITPKAQGTLKKLGQGRRAETWKDPGDGVCCVIMSPILEISSIKSQQHYCSKVSQMRMTLVKKKRPQPNRKYHMQLRKARNEKGGFPEMGQ